MAQCSEPQRASSAPCPPSLDKMATSARQATRKARRAYQRIISGLHKPGSYRLITLTSSDQAPRDIQASWHILINRLRRLGNVRAYIKVIETRPDSRSHIHLIARGTYLDQALISALWSSIHNSPIVDIRAVQGGNRHRWAVARYLVKYLTKELHRRVSPSRHWLYPGSSHAWNSLVRATIRCNQLSPGSVTWSQVLSAWHVHLQQGAQLGTTLKHLALHCLHWFYSIYAYQSQRAPRVLAVGWG